MHSPRITVVITTHNRRQYLAEALQSVCNQTFSDFRVCVFDNASTDGTDEMLRAFQQAGTRICAHRQPRNIGSCRNIRIALTTPDTEYTAWLMDDDLWAPEHLADGVRLLDRFPEAVLYGAAAERFGHGEAGLIFPVFLASREGPSLVDFRADFAPMLSGTPVLGSSCIFRSRAIRYVGRWYLNAAIDWLFLGQLCFAGPAVFNPAVRVSYRWHGTNESHVMLGNRSGAVDHRFVLRLLANEALRLGIIDAARIERALLHEWSPSVAAAAMVALCSSSSDHALGERLLRLFRRSPELRRKSAVSGHCRLAARIGSRYLRYADLLDRIRARRRIQPL